MKKKKKKKKTAFDLDSALSGGSQPTDEPAPDGIFSLYFIELLYLVWCGNLKGVLFLYAF